jgi:hypothetical protein
MGLFSRFFAAALQQACDPSAVPTNRSVGQITQNPSSLFRKKISVFPKCKSGYMICIALQTEGVLRTSGRDSVEAAVRETGAARLNLFKNRTALFEM